jgi:hypothetical protein
VSEARSEIAALVSAWAFCRDQGSWDALLATFHEGATISISWFDGPHADFVAASKAMAARGDAIVQHHLGVPRIRVHGNRALSDVDVTILVRARTPIGEVDSTSYARFYDRLEKRSGTWKVSRRTAIYEKDRAAPVSRPTLPEAFFEGLDRFPAEVRFLAAGLERAGQRLSPRLVRDKSPEMRALYDEGEAWLSGGASR